MPDSYVVFMEATESNDSHVVFVQPESGEVRSPNSAPDRPEIGVYRTKLDPSWFKKFEAAFEKAGLGTHGPEKDIPAGDLVATFGIMDGEKPRVLYSYRTAEPPPKLEPAIKLLTDVQQEIYAHPLRVLRVGMAWAKEASRLGEDVKGTLRLEARGKEKVICRAPTAGAGETPPDMGLIFYRAGPDSARTIFREAHFKAGDVRPKGTEAGPAPKGGDLELAAGSSREYSFSTPVRLPVGSYPTLFHFASDPAGETPPESFLIGTVEIEPAPFKVVKE